MIDKAKMLEMAEDIKDTIQEKQEQTILDYKIYSLCCQVQALLKEQEPKLVRIDEDSVHCPSCGNELFTFPRQKFCDECGQAVMWDDV